MNVLRSGIVDDAAVAALVFRQPVPPAREQLKSDYIS